MHSKFCLFFRSCPSAEHHISISYRPTCCWVTDRPNGFECFTQAATACTDMSWSRVVDLCLWRNEIWRNHRNISDHQFASTCRCWLSPSREGTAISTPAVADYLHPWKRRQPDRSHSGQIESTWRGSTRMCEEHRPTSSVDWSVDNVQALVALLMSVNFIHRSLTRHWRNFCRAMLCVARSQDK